MHHTATQICKRLQEKGFEAFFAGGAVRDMLMGSEPEDIDIATNAKPEEIENIFTKSFAIGKHFGVILIEENGHHFEVATFRSDGGYTDGRRPDAVFFTNKKEDALRRDFTCNALFYDPITKKIHDFVGGKKDIEDRILRFVGDPDMRIQEDYLRILRAVRFKNRFDFTYGPKLTEAICTNTHLLKNIAAERVQKELEKMIESPNKVKAIRDMHTLGIIKEILPEVEDIAHTPDAYQRRSVLDHTLAAMKHLSQNASAELCWGLFFHDLGKATTIVSCKNSDVSHPKKRHDESTPLQENCIRFPRDTKNRNHYPQHEKESARIAKIICKRLKFSRIAMDKICYLAVNHIPFYQIPKMSRNTRLHFFDHPFFEDLLELCRCDAKGSSSGDDSLVKEIEEMYHNAKERKLLPQFHPEFLSGKEIMEVMNLPEGKEIGEIKHQLREKQIAGEIQTKEEAKEILTNLFMTNQKILKDSYSD
jgi:tRNA nucleotidyltransferase/poly(A) polymerase